jgi:tetratricopeptide (TPR) repeat protein
VLALGVPLLLYASARAVAVGVPRFERSAYDLLESPLAQAPFAVRLPASLSLVVDYLRMVALPWPLMALDFPARFPTWSDAEPWIGMVALAVLVGAAAWTCWRRDPYVLPLVWWLASFLVVSQLIVPAWTYREVRLAYPLLAGAALGVAWLVVGACWSRPHARAAALTSLAAYAIVCSALVVTRNADWRSDLAVAEADVRRDPERPSAQSKLGDMLDVNGRTQEAERAYQEAARLAPTSYQVWLQLAGFYERQNRLAEARQAYERATVVDPTFADAFVGLALLDMRAERLDEARALLLRAEQADPDDPFAQYNLAVLDEWAGKRADAIARLRRLVERHPDHRQGVEALATLTNGAAAR